MLFVKFPEPGKVKTRLAHSVGAQKAASIYKDVVDAIGTTLVSSRTEAAGKISLLVAFDPPERGAEIRSWLNWADGYFAQEGKDLGARLLHALHTVFNDGAKRVILLGSDTLDLHGEIVLEGFRLLEFHDVVLGPARDGGYYAIGVKKTIGQLFEGIRWSTSAVLETTRRRAEALGFSTKLLPLLSDLDE